MAEQKVIVLAMDQDEVVIVTPRTTARARGVASSGVALTASVAAAPKDVRSRMLEAVLPTAVTATAETRVRALANEVFVRTEAEANALPVGSIIRDNMHDARVKVSERGWEQSGTSGRWGPTWIAFPARVLFVPRDFDAALAAEEAGA
ncbi:hypothetical protein AB1K56_08080 [Microbacterium sp. BWR-S6Y]|uniref:hypothetical protein n=1 Tax=Microbacterium sp. BWR-S6Y TaxID=3232073 RepID=UPI0035290626